jgi:hypothetical protein
MPSERADAMGLQYKPNQYPYDRTISSIHPARLNKVSGYDWYHQLLFSLSQHWPDVNRIKL